MIALMPLNINASNIYYNDEIIDSQGTVSTETTETSKPIDVIQELSDPSESNIEMPTKPPIEAKEEVIEETTTPSQHEETKPVEEPKPTETKPNNKPNTSDTYVGRFKISSVGVNVGCYASSSQATVDATDSASYFFGYGHRIIADHNNQGFNGIKSCDVGTKATFTYEDGSVENLVCVGKIQGHNTGTTLTDANYTPIHDLYPGSIACYTCNDNWKNITIVFFMEESEVNNKKENNEEKPEETAPPAPVYGCKEGKHKWSDWKFEWAGSTNGKEFHWESHECVVCHDEEWELVYDYIPEPTPEPTTPEENTEDNTKTETTKEPETITEPIPQESEETVNAEINTTEPVVESTES